MGGFFWTYIELGNLLESRDAAAVDAFLTKNEIIDISNCYNYAGGSFSGGAPIYTALTFASIKDDFSLARVLLDHGACFDGMGKNPHTSKTFGTDPFTLAASIGMRNFMFDELIKRINSRGRILALNPRFAKASRFVNIFSDFLKFSGVEPRPYFKSSLESFLNEGKLNEACNIMIQLLKDIKKIEDIKFLDREFLYAYIVGSAKKVRELRMAGAGIKIPPYGLSPFKVGIVKDKAWLRGYRRNQLSVAAKNLLRGSLWPYYLIEAKA
jgi:hypothetical protein